VREKRRKAIDDANQVPNKREWSRRGAVDSEWRRYGDRDREIESNLQG